MQQCDELIIRFSHLIGTHSAICASFNIGSWLWKPAFQSTCSALSFSFLWSQHCLNFLTFISCKCFTDTEYGDDENRELIEKQSVRNLMQTGKNGVCHYWHRESTAIEHIRFLVQSLASPVRRFSIGWWRDRPSPENLEGRCVSERTILTWVDQRSDAE